MAAALQHMLAPRLVLCARCRAEEKHSTALEELADEEDDAVLVREVCVARDCVELQVCHHLCLHHVLQYELAWRHCIPVRCCTGCKQNVLDLYEDQQDVWFVLSREVDGSTIRGVEKRWLDRSEVEMVAFASPKLQPKKGSKRTRNSERTLRQLREKERLRAIEWSIGNNLPKRVFKWKDNKHRLDADEQQEANRKGDPDHVPRVLLPEPDEVFCVVEGCQFYAKTGDRCRFHAAAALAMQARLPTTASSVVKLTPEA